VIFDDYGSASTPGDIRLVEEMAMRDDLFFVSTFAGQAIFVKLK